jgi:hypothetical protein
LLPAFALLIAIACAAASAARLKFALAPTVLDIPTLVLALANKTDDKVALLRAAATHDPEADWELGLLDAMGAPPSARIALVNEQLRELDHRVGKWSRVPRVCASICTSAGLLLATIALRVGLTASTETVDGRSIIHTALIDAIDVAAIGLAGATFCITIQMRSRRAASSRAQAVDRLVERLERLAEATGPDRSLEETGTSTVETGDEARNEPGCEPPSPGIA